MHVSLDTGRLSDSSEILKHGNYCHPKPPLDHVRPLYIVTALILLVLVTKQNLPVLPVLPVEHCFRHRFQLTLRRIPAE